MDKQLVILWFDEQPNERHIIVRKELIGEQIERAADKYIAATKGAGKRERTAFIAGVRWLMTPAEERNIIQKV